MSAAGMWHIWWRGSRGVQSEESLSNCRKRRERGGTTTFQRSEPDEFFCYVSCKLLHVSVELICCRPDPVMWCCRARLGYIFGLLLVGCRCCFPALSHFLVFLHTVHAAVSLLYRKWSWLCCCQVIDSTGITTCELFPCLKACMFLSNPDALRQENVIETLLRWFDVFDLSNIWTSPSLYWVYAPSLLGKFWYAYWIMW